MRYKHRRWTEEEVKELVRLHYEGKTHEEIAVALNRSHFAVRSKLEITGKNKATEKQKALYAEAFYLATYGKWK